MQRFGMTQLFTRLREPSSPAGDSSEQVFVHPETGEVQRERRRLPRRDEDRRRYVLLTVPLAVGLMIPAYLGIGLAIWEARNTGEQAAREVVDEANAQRASDQINARIACEERNGIRRAEAKIDLALASELPPAARQRIESAIDLETKVGGFKLESC